MTNGHHLKHCVLRHTTNTMSPCHKWPPPQMLCSHDTTTQPPVKKNNGNQGWWMATGAWDADVSRAPWYVFLYVFLFFFALLTIIYKLWETTKNGQHHHHPQYRCHRTYVKQRREITTNGRWWRMQHHHPQQWHRCHCTATPMMLWLEESGDD